MHFNAHQHRLSRAAVAGLATLGLSASILGLSLATAPGAQAAGVITSVVINEVESNADATNGDWIELYNNDGVNSVDLTGATLSDSDPAHSIALSGSIAPHGFVTVKVDDPLIVGDFGLGGVDSARLLDGSSNVVDSYSWTNHASTTYGRYPDGAGGSNTQAAFYTTDAGTFNAANDVTVPDPQPEPDTLIGVYINEVETQGDTTHGDWIELYNSTGDDVDLAGAVLADNNNSHTYTIPSGTIATDGYFTVVVEDTEAIGPFALGDVDSARLFEPGTTDVSAATAVDSYSWSTHAATTYGRDWTDPDGSGAGTWKLTSAGTYDAVNTFSVPGESLAGKVVINEVESNPGVSPAKAGDWIELYNKSGATVSIAGAVLSDSDNTHVFQVPPGTPALASHAYVAFRVDDSLVDGNFGLGAGDSARLFNPGANLVTDTPVDSYSWTAHAGQTYGRCTDGTGSFVNTVAPTPGAANSCP